MNECSRNHLKCFSKICIWRWSSGTVQIFFQNVKIIQLELNTNVPFVQAYNKCITWRKREITLTDQFWSRRQIINLLNSFVSFQVKYAVHAGIRSADVSCLLSASYQASQIISVKQHVNYCLQQIGALPNGLSTHSKYSILKLYFKQHQ